MTDEEIKLIKGYFNDGYCCDLDELKNIVNKMINENNQLQSNWNSLREWIKENKKKSNDEYYGDDILDKMNELEGRKDE